MSERVSRVIEGGVEILVPGEGHAAVPVLGLRDRTYRRVALHPLEAVLPNWNDQRPAAHDHDVRRRAPRKVNRLVVGAPANAAVTRRRIDDCLQALLRSLWQDDVEDLLPVREVQDHPLGGPPGCFLHLLNRRLQGLPAGRGELQPHHLELFVVDRLASREFIPAQQLDRLVQRLVDRRARQQLHQPQAVLW